MPHNERHSITTELAEPFLVTRPTTTRAPFVWCSPHSGRVYPQAFLNTTRLDPLSLRKSEDCYVDDLISKVPSLGVPLLCAQFPRAYLDVNREPYELDPILFQEPMPDFANTQSARVIGGIGTIPRIVADGENIYAGPISLAAAFQRIELLYKPYHAALSSLLDETFQTFGVAVLIDCHSMPSALMAQSNATRPDFVLGDRFGAACDPTLTAFVKNALQRHGYHIQLNRPYAGGYITEHYGRPLRGIHALQIEMNRGLYVDERTMKPTPGFISLQANLMNLAARLATELTHLGQHSAAAE
jgi:N-formylglutamate amidohydrolase